MATRQPSKLCMFVSECVCDTWLKTNVSFACLRHGCMSMWPFVLVLLQFCCSAHYVIPPAALSLSLSIFPSSHFTLIFLSAVCGGQTELRGQSHGTDTNAQAPPVSTLPIRRGAEFLIWIQSKTLSHYFSCQMHKEQLPSPITNANTDTRYRYIKAHIQKGKVH